METMHSGKRGERVPTGITLVEFASNGNRDRVFKYLENQAVNDSSGAKLSIKRGSTAQQPDRNAKLVEAESKMKGFFFLCTAIAKLAGIFVSRVLHI